MEDAAKWFTNGNLTIPATTVQNHTEPKVMLMLPGADAQYSIKSPSIGIVKQINTEIRQTCD